MIKSKLLVSALILVGLTASAFGGGHKSGENLTTFQKSFLAHYTSETDKLISLAEAFSDEGLKWQPADGIRSVRQAMLHVASGNYYIGGLIGGKVPEGLNPRQFEKTVTTKAEVIETLKKSIAFVKESVSAHDEESLNEQIKLFGNEVPRMQAVLLLGGHNFEHLGQLIAYARSTGVVPTWSK